VRNGADAIMPISEILVLSRDSPKANRDERHANILDDLQRKDEGNAEQQRY
jgi:hypothetical protein